MRNAYARLFTLLVLMVCGPWLLSAPSSRSIA